MTTAIAMLVQNTLDPTISPEAVETQFRTDWSKLSPQGLTGGCIQDGVVNFDYGEFTVMIKQIPSQIGDDTGDLCQSSRLWPEAAEFNRDYQAFSIVSVFTPEENLELAATVLLSQVIASIIEVSQETFAIYWGGANHLILPQLFRELALEILPEPLCWAWIAINMGIRPEDGILTAHTVGLHDLGLMDIEIPESNNNEEETFTFISNMAMYLLENGLVIQDGDTVGSSDTERIKAVYAPSLVDPDKTVIRILSTAGPQSPKSKKRFNWFGKQK